VQPMAGVTERRVEAQILAGAEPSSETEKL
jgi:hypothetical protein